MNTVKELAKKWYEIIDFPEKFDEGFEKLLAEENNVFPMKFSEYDLVINRPNKGKNLIMFLYFCEELSQKYEEKGIPREILLNTIDDFKISVERQYDINGVVGIVMASVLAKHLSMKLFRLGRLQFCMEEISVDVPEKGILKGTPVMDIHIPTGGSITKEELTASFKMAEEFFGKYFPEYCYDYYMCHSWLLDVTLKKFLKEGSNILEFQKIFYPVSKREDDAILRFMFKYHIETREELNECPANTQFAKNVKEYALSDGKFYNVLGVVERDKIGG